MKNLIASKRLIGVSLVIVLTAGIASAASIWVFGNGVNYGPDRDSVDSQAYNDAVMNANTICPGVIDGGYFKTSDTCGNLGSDDNPNWMCAVSVKAICRAGR